MTEADKKTLEVLKAIERRKPENWLDIYMYDLFSEIRDNWNGRSVEYSGTLLLTDKLNNTASIRVIEALDTAIVQVSTGCMFVKLNGDTLEIGNTGRAMVLDDGTYKIPLFY